MVFQGGFIVHHDFLIWFFLVFGWFQGGFMVSMAFGWFPWFFKVVSWFIMIFGWFPWFLVGLHGFVS